MKRTTPGVLLVLVLLAFGVLVGLGVLAGELLELAERRDGSTAVDSAITTWVVAHRSSGLTTLARLLSTIGSQAVLVPISAVVALVLVRMRQLVPAGLLVAGWGGGLALYSLVKVFVQRQRPPMEIWLTRVVGSSFPSGHATQSLATFAALALVAASLWRWTRVWALVAAIVLAAGVGWSRVYLGVHWATDVAAGWLFAGIWIAVVVWLTQARSIKRRDADRRLPVRTTGHPPV